jgi:hypothetical protein
VDIDMTIDAFYFKHEDGTFHSFKHRGESNISYSMAEVITEEEADWDNLKLRKI